MGRAEFENLHSSAMASRTHIARQEARVPSDRDDHAEQIIQMPSQVAPISAQHFAALRTDTKWETSAVRTLLQMQRNYGNRLVRRLLQDQA